MYYVVDHEFGHFVNSIIERMKNKSREKQIDAINIKTINFQKFDNDLQHKFKTVLSKLENSNRKNPEIFKKIKIENIKQLFEFLDKCYVYARNNDIISNIKTNKLKSENEYAKKYFEKLKSEVAQLGGDEKSAPSFYATKNKMEFFAETRANSKAPIYKKILKNFKLSMNKKMT